jgi:hypothetical protein
MYCRTFVRYCYRESGKEFYGQEVSVSNITPGDMAQAGIKANVVEIYKP